MIYDIIPYIVCMCSVTSQWHDVYEHLTFVYVCVGGQCTGTIVDSLRLCVDICVACTFLAHVTTFQFVICYV